MEFIHNFKLKHRKHLMILLRAEKSSKMHHPEAMGSGR